MSDKEQDKTAESKEEITSDFEDKKKDETAHEDDEKIDQLEKEVEQKKEDENIEEEQFELSENDGQDFDITEEEIGKSDLSDPGIQSCYNCGQDDHLPIDCKKESIIVEQAAGDQNGEDKNEEHWDENRNGNERHENNWDDHGATNAKKSHFLGEGTDGGREKFGGDEFRRNDFGGDYGGGKFNAGRNFNAGPRQGGGYCFKFQSGNCNFGDNCRFAHVPAEDGGEQRPRMDRGRNNDNGRFQNHNRNGRQQFDANGGGAQKYNELPADDLNRGTRWKNSPSPAVEKEHREKPRNRRKEKRLDSSEFSDSASSDYHARPSATEKLGSKIKILQLQIELEKAKKKIRRREKIIHKLKKKIDQMMRQ